MPSATLSLSALDGTLGFIVSGVSSGDEAGGQVASVGDLNGDGFDDFIVGVFRADPGGRANAGSAYVVFGKAGGFANLSLADLNGANGFRIDGAAAGDWLGSVGSAGDINGDGYDDLFVGAYGADLTASNSGGGYVLFGKAGGWDATVSVYGLDGTSGFRLVDGPGNGFMGFAVSSAGDFNGDGYDELIIGAPNSNATYVLYGKAGGFTASLSLVGLTGAAGFRVDGPIASSTGVAVNAAGDVNGDGYDDLVIGAGAAAPHGSTSGSTYVVFGRAASVGSVLSLSGINGSNGFRLDGGAALDYSGWAVNGAGDVNGDGFDDVIVGARLADAGGANSGAAYVFFGHADGFGATYNLAGLNGSDGFAIHGAAAGDQLGWSVAGAGDVNNDGYDDVIVGAERAAVNGAQSGAAYVIYGKADGFAAALNVASLDGFNGFRLNGPGSLALAGGWVGSAGDINNDGADDVIVGARGAGGSGAAYIVFGDTGPLSLVGDSGANTFVGAANGDTLSGQGGNDVLSGMGGDDRLDGGDLSDRLYGGDGLDTLLGGGGGDIMYGDAGDDDLDGGEGADKLSGGTGDDELTGGLGNDRLDGGDGHDILTGGDGNDVLEGGVAADTLIGGLGNDIYVLDVFDFSDFSDHDTLVEAANGGYDIVRSLRSYTLASNLEGLELLGFGNLSGGGNELANNIKGNAGDNSLSGLQGVDTIDGGDGNDTVTGGQGGDRLYGGAGRDYFIVTADSFGQSTIETDQIFDFSIAEGDRLFFNTIDAIPGGADDAFTCVGTSFTRHAGEMTLSYANGITLLRLDITGDGKADYQMKINGDVTNDWVRWFL